MPKFSKIKESDLPAFFRIVVAVNFFIVIIAIAFTNFFYASFLHISYASGLTAFYLMLPGYFLFSLVLYLAAYFSWLGKFHYNLYGSVLCLLIILIADWLLIPANSFNGAAISNTIAYSSVFIYYLFLLHKKFAFKFWKFSLPKRDEFFLLINQLK